MNIRYDGADNLLIIDGEYYSNQFVVQKNSPGNVGIGTASPSEKLHINDGNLMVDGNVTSPSFTSGFAGSGYRIETGSAGTSAFTIDNLTVRGTMSVYELMIHQIRATNGSLFVANTGKITSASLNGNAYSMSMDTGSGYGHSFQVGDLIRAQRFVPSTNGSGSQVFKSDLHVISVEGTGSIVGVLTGSDVPQPGYEYVRIGSISDTERQGSIYLTADDGNAPFIDVVDELTAHSQFNTAGKTKVRMGKLSGITSPTFGTLPGYGFYASGSAFLEGSINATNGEIGGFTINSTAISASNLFMKSSGQITGSDVLFDGGTIGAWDITGFQLKSGGSSPNQNISLDATNKRITINTSSFGNEGIQLEYNGGTPRAHIGTNDVYFQFDGTNVIIETAPLKLDSSGNLTISGTLSSSIGNIGGFTIDADEIKSDNLKLNSSDESLQLGTVSSSQNSSGTTKGLYASGSGYFFVGAEDGDFIKFNESDGTIAISSSDLKVEVGDLQITASDIDMTATEFNLNANSGDLLLDSVNHQVSLANGNIVLDGTDTGYLKIGGSVAFDTFNNTTKGILAQGDGDILIKGQVPNQYIQFKDGELDISTQKATISGSDVNILTPKIFLGQNNSNFISASEGNIEISSSNFHLQANGDLTASSVLFDGGTIEGPLKINNDVEIGGFNGFTTIFFDDFSQYANVPALTGSGNNPKTDGTGQGYFYFSGNGEVSLESGEGAIFGNKVIKLGNDSGNDQVWFSSNQLIPFNSQSLYEMEIRIKKEESDDDGSEYFGISGYAADGTTAVNIQGLDSLSSQHYFTLAGENVPNDSEWRIYKGYFKGHQNNVSSPGNKHATITDPGYVSTGSGNDGNKVMYFAPMFLTNYSGKDGTAYIDYIKVSEFNSNGGSKISGDNIQTGKITSNNLSTTAGSEFNLQDGTFKLGGTDNPDLSFDGTTLQVSGTLSSSIGNIGGWKIEATKLSKDDIVLDSIGKSIRLGTKQSLSDANAGIIMSASTGMAIGPEGTGFIARNDGRVTGSNVLFDGGKIGGFEITSTHISASDGGILISGSGEGELANGNITFDKFGNIDITDARLRISSDGFPLDAFNAATGKFVDMMTTHGNVEIVAFEDNTIVTRISQSGEIRDTFTLSGSQVTTKSDRQDGDIYDANKPIFAYNTSGAPLAPLSTTGKRFLTRTARDNPIKFNLFSPFGDAKVHIASGSDGSGVFDKTLADITVSQSLLTTQLGIDFATDTIEFFEITSSLPIVVSVNNTDGAGDFVYVPPVSKEVLTPSDINAVTLEGKSGHTISNISKRYYFSDAPFALHDAGDGSGTDGEHGLPIEMLGDTYVVPHTLSDYRIVAVESGEIEVFRVYEDQKILFDTHLISGSKTNPQEIEVGHISGSNNELFDAQSVRFEGTMPFFLRVNDEGQNEYPVLGYRRTQTPQYQNSTTIEGDRVRTGKIQSNNFSTTAGSEYNLNDGTFTLGGSTNPDLSFDGTTLEVSGTLSSSIGNIGGFTINSSEIKSNNANGDTGLTLKAGGQITASNAKITGEINATTGVFSGSISASAGQVGGWTINASTLTGGNVTLDSTGFIKVGTLGDAGDTATTNKGFFADNTGNVLIKGDDNDTNYIKFDEDAGKSALQIKTEAFELVDGNLEISGTLSSSRGNIGGWTLADSVITNGPAQLGTIGDFTGLHINATNNYWYSSSVAGVHFRVGGTNDFIKFVGDSDFSTTSFEISSSNIHISGGNAVFSGSVTATDGKIGGWHLKTNEISASGGISLNSSTSGNSPHLSLGTKVTALSSNAGVFIGKSTFLGSDYGIAIGNTDVFSNDGGILMAAGLTSPSSNTIFAAGEIGNAYANTQGNASYFMYRPSSGIVIQHPNFMMRDGVLRISSSEANNTIIQLDSDGHTKGIDIKSNEGIIGHGDSTNRELTTHEGNFIFSENVISIAAGGGGIGTDAEGDYELFGDGGADDTQTTGGHYGGT
tara:strand:- start:3106 stop:9012 length:5907 start_codon:yes stop_codon:yes gene_type:complete